MNIVQAIILGLIQGLTEFIPVSSSGHLIIAHRVLGLSEGGFTFDMALNIGTLLVLMVFFRKDIWEIGLSLFKKSPHTRIAWLLVGATVPAVIAGVLLESRAKSVFRSLPLVACDLIAAGAIMLLAEYYGRGYAKRTQFDHVTGKQAAIMGLAQAVAIIPGVSRSGSTISAGIFSGLSRASAARFSFLLAIPITVGAVLKTILEGNALAQISQESGVFAAGVAASFVSGFFAIKFLLRYLSDHSLSVFAYYRFVLGAIVLVWALANR